MTTDPVYVARIESLARMVDARTKRGHSTEEVDLDLLAAMLAERESLLASVVQLKAALEGHP